MFKKNEKQYHAVLDKWSQKIQLGRDVASTCVH